MGLLRLKGLHLSPQESELAAQVKIMEQLREELVLIKEQESSLSKVWASHGSNLYCSVPNLPICLQENTTMSTQLNDLRLQLQRLDYEAKEGKITVDILKDQNQDLSRELEELQKSLNELKVSAKDSAASDDKERKKAEKMALMMAKFDVVRPFRTPN